MCDHWGDGHLAVAAHAMEVRALAKAAGVDGVRVQQASTGLADGLGRKEAENEDFAIFSVSFTTCKGSFTTCVWFQALLYVKQST